MSWLELFAVTMVLAIVRQVVKNPAHAAAVKNDLLGVADDIYIAYGVTPPTHP